MGLGHQTRPQAELQAPTASEMEQDGAGDFDGEAAWREV